MTRCTFKQCGSYAFNLYKEDIDQGDLCDHHYWQDQAQKAVLAEREACAKVCDSRYMGDNNREDMEARRCAEAIRARGNK